MCIGMHFVGDIYIELLDYASCKIKEETFYISFILLSFIIGFGFVNQSYLSVCLLLSSIIMVRFLLIPDITVFSSSIAVLLHVLVLSGLLLSTLPYLEIPRFKNDEFLRKDVKENYEMSTISVIRRRRASSIEIPTFNQNANKTTPMKTRRKSLPALGMQAKKTSISSMDVTILGEAHGMITDLLVDSSLPLNVSGTLRIVADMISPLLQQGMHRSSFSNPLLTVFEKRQTDEDAEQVMNQPDLKDDTPLSLKQRLQRNLGVSTRRMSSSYTTTTSATGMPTIAMEYHANSSPNNNKKTTAQSRSKSYAGMGLKTHKDRIRTLSHKSFSFNQQESKLVRSADMNKSIEEDIFKVEIQQGTPVYFEGMDSESDTESDTSSVQAENIGNVDAPTSWSSTKLPSISEPEDDVTSHIIENKNIRENKETNDSISKQDSINKPSQIINTKHENTFPANKDKNKTAEADLTNHVSPLKENFSKELSSSNEISSSKEISSSNIEYSKPPPLSQRTANPIVAQVLPVCKESNNGEERRTSDGLIVPHNNTTRRRSSRELHYEYEVAVSKDIDSMLCELIEWDFPIFELAEKCNILTQLAFRIFQVSGFFTKFKIPETTFLKYFRALESGYHNIPYHNRIHAADVLHGVYYFTQHKIPGFNSNLSRHSSTANVSNPSIESFLDEEDQYTYGCMSNVMPDLELMALYTAAAMHDFDHPGRTNAFLVATLNSKALLYNDRSVLENHHAAASWSLLVTNPGLNFLSSLDSADFKRFRFIVIEEILSTDLKKHFDFLAEWNEKNSDQGSGLNFELEADRLLVGQMAIKIADISGPSKEWTLHNRWTDRIIEEFYQQGEDERILGMPLSAYMDRNDSKVPELQSSFIKHLVSPLYLAYEKAGILPGKWVDKDDDDDDDDDDGDNTYNRDNASDGDSSDVEKNEDKGKKKVIFNIVLDNIHTNHERWLKLIEEKSKDDLQTDRPDEENSLHEEIEEEEMNSKD